MILYRPFLSTSLQKSTSCSLHYRRLLLIFHVFIVLTALFIFILSRHDCFFRQFSCHCIDVHVFPLCCIINPNINNNKTYWTHWRFYSAFWTLFKCICSVSELSAVVTYRTFLGLVFAFINTIKQIILIWLWKWILLNSGLFIFVASATNFEHKSCHISSCSRQELPVWCHYLQLGS